MAARRRSEIVVEWNDREWTSMLRAMGEKDGRKVARTAINQTARQTRTEAARRIAKLMGIKVGEARKALQIIFASQNRLEARVIASGRPRNLIHFQARQTRKGVTAKAWGTRKLYKGSFIITSPQGQKLVMKRRGKDRLPIEPLWGPSVPDTMVNEEIRAALQQVIVERLPKNLRRQYERRQRLIQGLAARGRGMS